MLSGIDIDDKFVLRQHIRKVVTHCVKHKDVYKVDSVMDIQFITFEKKMRDMVNEEAEYVFRELHVVPFHPGKPQEQLRKHLTVYVGVKLCFRENFKAYTVAGNAGRSQRQYDEIRNGECGTVLHFFKNADQRLEITIQMPNVVKHILIDKKHHVNPSAVHLGHCITSNISQGDEFNTVIGIMQEINWITRAHLYVMSSRAKKAYISMCKVPKGEALFNTICQRIDQRRVTALRQALLRNTFNFQPHQNPEHTQLIDTKDLVLNTDKHIPCVPVPPKKE